jgi:hypothetical protein
MNNGPRPPLSRRGPPRGRRPEARAGGGGSRLTGRDVAGAGVLMLSANLLCMAIAAGLGVLFGAVVPLAVAGFLIGFFVGIYVVAKRFREI